MSRKIGSKNKHHKEKPIKEKKQRGRPKGSIKQKQEQHQIVNVNIGSIKTPKRRTRKQQPQQPTLIFNPSVSLPSFGYSNREPANPPVIPDFSNVVLHEPPIPESKPKPIPSAIPISEAKQQPSIPTGIPISESMVKPIQTEEISIAQPIKPSKEIKPSFPIVQASAPPLEEQIKPPSKPIISDIIHKKYDDYEHPSQAAHLEHEKKFKQIYEDINPKYKDTEGLGKIVGVDKLAKNVLMAAGGGAITGGFGALAAGTSILEGAYSGAMISGFAAIGNEIAGDKGATIGASVGGGIVARNHYKKYLKNQKNETNETNQQADFDKFLEETESKKAKKLRKPRHGNMISISENVPTPIFVQQNEKHLLDSPKPLNIKELPRTNKSIEDEKYLIDYKKMLFEQNLKRAHSTQEKEDAIESFRKDFRDAASKKITDRIIAKQQAAVQTIEGAILNRNAKAKLERKRVRNQQGQRLMEGLTNVYKEEVAIPTIGNRIKAAVQYNKYKQENIDKAYDQAFKETSAVNILQNAIRGHQARNEVQDMKKKKSIIKQLQTLTPNSNLIASSSAPPPKEINVMTQQAARMTVPMEKKKPQEQAEDRRKRIVNVLQNAQSMTPASNISNTGLKAAKTIQKVIRGHQTRKDIRNTILNIASDEKQAATTLQNAIRGHQSRHRVRNEKKMTELANNQLQAGRLLASRAKTKLTYSLQDSRNTLEPQHIGKPLVVLKNSKQLILKERHDRGVKAAKTRYNP